MTTFDRSPTPKIEPAIGPDRRLRPGTEELVFIGRSVRLGLRNVETLLMAIILPVTIMLMFTFVFGHAIDPSGNYVNYVVPGIVLLCAGFGASSTGVDVATDMSTGIIDRFRTMPIRSWAVLTGHVAASLIRNLLATAVVIAVALAVGFRPQADFWAWLGTLCLVALYILTITYLFAAIGLTAGNPAAANGYGFVLLFLPYLSSAFVPTGTMPGWLRAVAEHQPITPIIETLRGLLTSRPLGEEPWIALAWCLGLLAVAVFWGTRVFRSQAGRRD